MVFKFGEHPKVDVIENESIEGEFTCDDFKELLDFVIDEFIFHKDELLAEHVNAHDFARGEAKAFFELKKNQHYDGVRELVARTIFEVALVLDRGMGFGRRDINMDKADAAWQANMVRLINQYIDDPELPALIERSWECFNAKFWAQAEAEPFISGVKGVVTATHLLRDLNLDLRLPTPEEDVEHKVDLWARHQDGDQQKVLAWQIKTSKHFSEPHLHKVSCQQQDIIGLKKLCSDLQFQLNSCEPEEEREIRLDLDIARSKISMAEYINKLREEDPNVSFEAYWLSIPSYLSSGAINMDPRTGRPKERMKTNFLNDNINIIKQFS